MQERKLTVPKDFVDLPTNERIAFVQDLWDYIAASPDQVDVPKAHKAVLEHRGSDLRGDQSSAAPWPEVREHLLGRIKGS